MGYPIYRDVKLWAPAGLTKGEKLAALVLADDANDTTRLTYSSTEDPEILRQALVPDDRAMRRIIAVLRKERVIEHAGGGFNGSTAKFRFLHLDPAGCPGKPKCHCPIALGMAGENHPASDGPGGTDEATEGGQKSPANSDGASAENHPASDAEGGRFSAGRRVKTTRPTPSTSSTTSSSTARKRADAASPKASKHAVADELTASFWKVHGKTQAQGYPAVLGVIRTAISNGRDRDDLAHALDQLAREGRPISGGTLQVALRARSHTSSNHQPYRTPNDPSIYDSEF